jgi:hypothetical protein
MAEGAEWRRKNITLHVVDKLTVTSEVGNLL